MEHSEDFRSIESGTELIGIEIISDSGEKKAVLPYMGTEERRICV